MRTENCEIKQHFRGNRHWSPGWIILNCTWMSSYQIAKQWSSFTIKVYLSLFYFISLENSDSFCLEPCWKCTRINLDNCCVFFKQAVTCNQRNHIPWTPHIMRFWGIFLHDLVLREHSWVTYKTNIVDITQVIPGGKMPGFCCELRCDIVLKVVRVVLFMQN